MKKILFFVQLPPPLHGASLCNKNIVESTYIKSNFETRTLPISFNKSIEEMQRKSVLKLLKVFPLFFSLIKELSLFKPDIVYFSISPLGASFLRDILFVSVLKLFKSNILFHLHGKGISDVTSPLLKFLYRFSFNNSTVICLSPTLAKDIDDVKGNAVIHICPNGAIVGCLQNNTDGYLNKIKLLFLSNLLPAKGIRLYLEAASLLVADGFDIEINIAGPCNDKYKEVELTEFLELNPNLKKVTNYYGSVSGDKKWAVLSEADILVHPTFNDALPLVILEAMAAGCLVISTRQGGIPDVLENKSFGFLLDEITTNSLHIKLKSLLMNRDKFTSWSKESESEFNEKYSIHEFERKIGFIFKELK